MKKNSLILLCFLAAAHWAYSQDFAEELQYRRSSIYSILINHTEQKKYAAEVRQRFLDIPVDDKYNDHNLSVRVVGVDKKYSEKEMDLFCNEFVEKNHIASRLVAKWFMRDHLTGGCSMELIKKRGVYNASEFDKEVAQRNIRGLSMLQDAGEDLIGNTYVLINEVRYIDKGEQAKVAGAILNILVSVAGAAVGVDTKDTGKNLQEVIESIKGFRVKITTRLYRLDWNDTVANIFYSQYYSANRNDAKRDAFNRDRDLFKLKYIGKVTSSGSKTSFLGISEEEPLLMIRKAIQRAIDENVVDLQKNYPQFRTRTPILDVEPRLTAAIGMKDGVSADKKYEVLEAIERNGKTEYRRVGIVKAVDEAIWDNRFMAVDEGAENASLGYTAFEIISGKGFYPGMLLKEM